MQTTTKQQIKERPILFSGEMVRAILGGRKTQTRRVVKNKTALDWLLNFTPEFVSSPENNLCPYGKPGERLWVRETWNQFGGQYAYAATDTDVYPETKWRPSIHMPRSASRILLEIESVRVERVQDISEHDAISEGILSFRPVPGDGAAETLYRRYSNVGGRPGQWTSIPELSFRSLWEKINGPESWKQNPWVWVIVFKHV